VPRRTICRSRTSPARTGERWHDDPGGHRKPGWWLTRIEFVAAITSFTVVAVTLVATPTTFGTYDGPRPPLWWLLSPGVAIAGMLVGLLWMIRLYRAPLKLDSKAYWRYRDGA
jgi:hypothetical protein